MSIFVYGDLRLRVEEIQFVNYHYSECLVALRWSGSPDVSTLFFSTEEDLSEFSAGLDKALGVNSVDEKLTPVAQKDYLKKILADTIGRGLDGDWISVDVDGSGEVLLQYFDQRPVVVGYIPYEELHNTSWTREDFDGE